MTCTNYLLLFTALGYCAARLEEPEDSNLEERAVYITQLIEEYCRRVVPEAFEREGAPQGGDIDALLLKRAKDALELCLTEATLTFSSEQAADSILARISQRVSWAR